MWSTRLSWWVGGFDGKWIFKEHTKSTEIDHFGTIGSDFLYFGDFFLKIIDEFWSQQKSITSLNNLQI